MMLNYLINTRALSHATVANTELAILRRKLGSFFHQADDSTMIYTEF